MEVLQLLYDQDRRVCKTASKNKRTPMHTAGNTYLQDSYRSLNTWKCTGILNIFK